MQNGQVDKMIYEYKNISIKDTFNLEERDKIMNDMASQGWEYINSNGVHRVILVFRRKRQQSNDNR